ncbi:hypothetical protein N7470_008277 [Penicillium chermesinum]|nr:hypothetical protein N7470_008277 [Penicillium chermesinum]
MSTSSSFPTNSANALGLLTSLGGVIGYARTGSVPSIAAGLSIGVLYLLSAFRARAGQPYAEEIGLLASATGFKPVPTGLSVLATYGVVVFGLAFRGKKD